jgi:hypothetical protein
MQPTGTASSGDVLLSVANRTSLTELESSILCVLRRAASAISTGEIASSLPTYQNTHQHSALFIFAVALGLAKQFLVCPGLSTASSVESC